MAPIVAYGVLVGLDNLLATTGLGLLRVPAAKRRQLVMLFGLFEGLMPLLGLLAGRQLRAHLAAASLVGPLLLAMCGGRALFSSVRGASDSRLFLALPLALSIDNLLAGAGFGVMSVAVVPAALVIGGISAALCLVGLVLGEHLRGWIPGHAGRLGAAWLLVLAVVPVLLDGR